MDLDLSQPVADALAEKLIDALAPFGREVHVVKHRSGWVAVLAILPISVALTPAPAGFASAQTDEGVVVAPRRGRKPTACRSECVKAVLDAGRPVGPADVFRSLPAEREYDQSTVTKCLQRAVKDGYLSQPAPGLYASPALSAAGCS